MKNKNLFFLIVCIFVTLTNIEIGLCGREDSIEDENALNVPFKSVSQEKFYSNSPITIISPILFLVFDNLPYLEINKARKVCKEWKSKIDTSDLYLTQQILIKDPLTVQNKLIGCKNPMNSLTRAFGILLKDEKKREKSLGNLNIFYYKLLPALQIKNILTDYPLNQQERETIKNFSSKISASGLEKITHDSSKIDENHIARLEELAASYSPHFKALLLLDFLDKGVDQEGEAKKIVYPFWLFLDEEKDLSTPPDPNYGYRICEAFNDLDLPPYVGGTAANYAAVKHDNKILSWVSLSLKLYEKELNYEKEISISPFIKKNYGEMLEKHGRYKEAEIFYRACLDDTEMNFYSYLADNLEKQDRIAEAEEILRESTHKNNEASSWTQLARFLKSNNRDDEALEAYKAALNSENIAPLIEHEATEYIRSKAL